MEQNERTLSKNKISNFILRIDFPINSAINYNLLSDSLLDIFPNRIVQVIPHFNINLDTKAFEQVDGRKYVFVVEDGVNIEISPLDNSIIFTSNHYSTNEIYKDRVLNIIEKLTSLSGDNIYARRIGLRYINTFPSEKSGGAPSILGPKEMRIINDSLKSKNELSRLIIVDEYLKENYKVRVQYGIPNKFYPNRITVGDLLVDIDVFNDGLVPIVEWNNIISQYNHAAYDTFLFYVKPSTIEKLR